jgi:preprotein translocase subunit SecD
MIESVKTRAWICLLVFLVTIIYVCPNFFNVGEKWWFSHDKITYGLDIQGGTHLVMGVDVNGVIAEKILRFAKSIEKELAGEGLQKVAANVLPTNKSEVVITTASADDLAKAKAYLEKTYPGSFLVVSSSGNDMNVQFLQTKVDEMRKQIIDQAIGVLRNRIDEFGVAEPVIESQGFDRIIVQLPGIKDAARAKELINRTARLSFAIVSDAMTPKQLDELIKKAETKGDYAVGKNGLQYNKYIKRLNEDLKTQIPENTQVAFEKPQNATNIESGKVPYLLRTDLSVGGEFLEDAHVGPDQMGLPIVNFKMSPEGRNLFGELTGKNINKPMAIVLDDIIQSTPVIQAKITDRGMITLGSRSYQETLKEANFVATVLRAGALPAALEQLEERTVGPSLGADSVRAGALAAVTGCCLILIFMLFYYRTLGFVADLALIFNFLLTVAILTSLGATLTLPGIAGLALTVGMAVDANVIIFERIKEEAARGATAKVAIREGFGHAFTAIFDANITAVSTCAVLLYYGTGPVKGFAVTLIAGIVTSMFTGVFFSRTLLELIIRRFNIQKIAST